MLQSRETSESRELAIGNTTALAIDNLKYDYTGNKLIRVTDEQQNPSGYPYMANPGTIGYDNDSSDGNGNMISNPDKGISAIQYNYLNLPQQITQNAKVTQYTYRADGVKVKKLFGDIETDYLDGLQYKSTFQIESWNGEGVFQPDPNEIPVLKLRIIPTAEGYYDVLNERYVYNYKDHLGNVRLSYTDTNKDGIIQPRRYYTSICTGKFCIDDWKPGEIVEVNNYYPFGMMHNYTATTQNAYQYKYNGKELQESGMYDYGARMYMPDLGRWGVIDPLAETSRRWSTYAYAYDNPVMFIDPDGMQNVSALHWKFDRNSTILGNSWFDDSYVSSGFGNNFKTMWNGGDHGGSGSRAFGQTQAYADLMDAFYNGGTGGLVNQNGTLKWWTDYEDPDPTVKGVGAFGILKLKDNGNNDDYWGILNNASTAQSYATNGIGLTLGTTAQVSNDLVNAGKMIKTPNIFKTYNLYRSNGYLNGNKYISGVKFMKNVKAINALNSSKVVKGVAYAGLAISMAQFYESHHPGYISRGILSYASGFIPYIGPTVSLGIDNTNVNYWNIWTWGAMNRGSSHYDYLNPEN